VPVVVEGASQPSAGLLLAVYAADGGVHISEGGVSVGGFIVVCSHVH